jgi:hypothetical protein
VLELRFLGPSFPQQGLLLIRTRPWVVSKDKKKNEFCKKGWILDLPIKRKAAKNKHFLPLHYRWISKEQQQKENRNL